MNRRDEKKKTWDAYHYGMKPEDIPLRMNSSFEFGFDGAWDAMQSEIRCIVTRLETVSTDQPDFRPALNRLRELAKEQQ